MNDEPLSEIVNFTEVDVFMTYEVGGNLVHIEQGKHRIVIRSYDELDSVIETLMEIRDQL